MSVFLLLDPGVANNDYLNNLTPVCIFTFLILRGSSLSTFSQLLPHNLAIFSVNLSQGHTAVLHQKQAWITDSLNPKAKGYLGSQYELTHSAQDFSAVFWFTCSTSELWPHSFQSQVSSSKQIQCSDLP